MVDGVVAGVWELVHARDAVTIAVTPFGRVTSATKKAVAEHAQSYGRILDAEVVMTWR